MTGDFWDGVFDGVESRMCNEDIDNLDQSDYEDTFTRSPAGGKDIPTRKFRDGTTQYDFGGPVGKVQYNRFGEEC